MTMMKHHPLIKLFHRTFVSIVDWFAHISYILLYGVEFGPPICYGSDKVAFDLVDA